MGSTFNSDRLRAMREAEYAKHAAPSAPAASPARSGCVQCAVYETEIARLKRDLASANRTIELLRRDLGAGEVVSNSQSNAVSNSDIGQSNKSNNAFDKAAYQREYMRQRRQSKKDTGQT